MNIEIFESPDRDGFIAEVAGVTVVSFERVLGEAVKLAQRWVRGQGYEVGTVMVHPAFEDLD